jgi:hypothetical protein
MTITKIAASFAVFLAVMFFAWTMLGSVRDEPAYYPTIISFGILVIWFLVLMVFWKVVLGNQNER